MNDTVQYDRSFFEKIEDGSRQSAVEVVPYVIGLLKPASVVDIGCGTGGWLSAFHDMGVGDFQGVDGDYVHQAALLIPRAHFLPADLRKPLNLGRRFDLVVSLEVAEHLPPECAETHIDNLVRHGDSVLFSAAIPNQGGTGHINEQWPEYWQKRFEDRGYILVDALRQRFWNNRNVERWYRQNLLLYVEKNRLDSLPDLLRERDSAQGRPLSLVHPATYAAPSLSTVMRMIPGTLLRGIRRRIPKKSP